MSTEKKIKKLKKQKKKQKKFKVFLQKILEFFEKKTRKTDSKLTFYKVKQDLSFIINNEGVAIDEYSPEIVFY